MLAGFCSLCHSFIRNGTLKYVPSNIVGRTVIDPLLPLELISHSNRATRCTEFVQLYSLKAYALMADSEAGPPCSNCGEDL